MSAEVKPSTGPSGQKEGGERQHRVVRTFMTQDMTDDDILMLSTGREPELARIVDAIERSRKAAPGALQHLVLYGNRGFGKSFMTRRVQIEVAARWPDTPVLLLPEEQHGLQRDPHALLDTIALRLADSRSGGNSSYEEGHFRWPSADAAARLWTEAETRVEQALDAALPTGGIAVVVVENFDILLRRLFREDVDEQRLRRWLDRPGNRLMLFATATGTVDMDYDRPLFQAFESVRLEPWSGDDCIAYFGRLRAHQGLEPLGPVREAKARAVADFIGGTPRLARLLGDVLETDDALEVAEIMAALTDRLADYYRRRIEDLAPLSIGLLDALIRGGEPASQTELAARVGAGGQSDIARVMAELQRADIVRGLPAPDSREKLYSVPDRVFVHYYRLRQGSLAAQRTPLATILDFLRSFYSRDERQRQSLAHLEAGRLPEAGLFSRLAREGEAQRAGDYTRYFVDALRRYLEEAPGAIERTAEEVAALLDGDSPEDALTFCEGVEQPGRVGAVRAIVRAQALYRLGHTEEAQAVLEAARERSQSDATASFIVLEQLLGLAESQDRVVAVRVAEALEGIGGDLPRAMEARRIRHIALRLALLGRHDDALEAAARAATLAAEVGDTRGEAVSLRHRAFSLGALGRHEEAVETAGRAAERAAVAGDIRGEAVSLRYRAFSLGQSGRHKEAVETARRAAQRAVEVGDISEEEESLRHLAYSLGHLRRHEEAVETAARAAERAAESGNALEEAASQRLRAFSLGKLGRYEEAWMAAQKSAAIARREANAYQLAWSILESLRAAAHLVRPEVVQLFGEWLRLDRRNDEHPLVAPLPAFGDLVAAVARADAWAALDDLLEEHAPWLAKIKEPVYFHDADGEAFARIGAEMGRAAGYRAMAEALPRIAGLMARLPGEARNDLWLPDIAEGFAAACRDPGLLRDVATLMTPEIAPEAEETARLLQTLADVDEAARPETVLARLDPDVATLIRRLRGLRDPAPPAKKGRGGKRG